MKSTSQNFPLFLSEMMYSFGATAYFRAMFLNENSR